MYLCNLVHFLKTPKHPQTPFATLLEKHYHEDCKQFESALNTVHDLRDKIVFPSRTEEGRAAHISYYHHMVHVEHRFFKDFKNPDISFRWFDSFNGQPTIQKSLALEKACVLFNTGALSIQLAATQNLEMIEVC